MAVVVANFLHIFLWFRAHHAILAVLLFDFSFGVMKILYLLLVVEFCRLFLQSYGVVSYHGVEPLLHYVVAERRLLGCVLAPLPQQDKQQDDALRQPFFAERPQLFFVALRPLFAAGQQPLVPLERGSSDLRNNPRLSRKFRRLHAHGCHVIQRNR